MSASGLASWKSPRGVCLLTVLALLALQWNWPGRIQPGPGHSGAVVAAILSSPLALLAWGLWRNWRSAKFWSGVAALFYFSHGVAEAWAIPAAQMAGLGEALLAVVLVLASSWDGLRARFGSRQRRNV